MYNILSVDGGGVRGIIPAMILDYIYTKTKRPIFKLFDLMAGTSTGGIIALGLACKYKPTELVTLYEKESKNIFKRQNCLSMGNMLDCILNIGGEKYNIHNLNEVMRKYFGNKYLKDAKTDVIITSYNLKHGQPYFFKSRAANMENAKNFLMCDVACATATAPTYFEPYKVKNNVFIDGVVFANNPAICAVAEAIKAGATTTDTLVISIGTGDVNKKYNYDKVKNWGIIHWARPVIDIQINGQSQATDYQLVKILGQNYFRLNPTIEESCADIDNASDKNIARLKGIACKYIEENKVLLDKICDKLM